MASHISFPENIEDDNYILYSVIKHTKNSRAAPEKFTTEYSISLPMPSNLKTNTKANYKNENLGAFGAMVTGDRGATEAVDGGTDMANVMSNNLSSRFANKVQMENLIGAAIPVAAATVLGLSSGVLAGALALGGGTGGVVSGIFKAGGVAINPHVAVLFDGADFRSHNFGYRFLAKNKKESDNIREIIRRFEYYMSPAVSHGGLAYVYPEEFIIEFPKNKEHLYKIGKCVLNGLDVNYNGENTPLFFEESNAPVIIDISLSFQETHIRTKRDIDSNLRESSELSAEEKFLERRNRFIGNIE